MKTKSLLLLLLAMAVASAANANTLSEVEALGKEVDDSSGDFNAFMQDYVGDSWDEDAAMQANNAAPDKAAKQLNVNREKSDAVSNKTVKQVINEKLDFNEFQQAKGGQSDEVTPELQYVSRKNLSGSTYVDSKSQDGLYASNIPQTSALVFQDVFKILPYNSVAYYQNGKRLYGNPMQKTSDEFENSLGTFCKLNFIDFEIGRTIDETQEFLIKKVRYSEADMKFAVHGDVTIRELSIELQNPHLKSLYCLSTDKTRPLTIGNIKYEMGGLVDFKLRDFVGI